MQSLSVTLLCALVISVECMHLPADTPHDEVPRNSTPCSIDPNGVCSSISVSENYSMQLDARHFYDSGEIRVKVYKTVCELNSIRSPWWYQLEVLEKIAEFGSGASSRSSAQDGSSNETSVRGAESEENGGAGVFKAPQAYELKICKHDTTVVFSSCSPIPLDLPRHFTWKATKSYSKKDSLCFRLTLQLSGDRGCRQKEICISVGDIPVSPISNEGEGSGNYDYVYAKVSEVSSSNLLADVDTDLDMVDMDVEEILMEVIGETFQDDDEEVIVPADKGCFVAQAFFTDNNLPWVPDCDCQGNYKSVQCVEGDEGLQCWCSTPSGSEIHNSRKTLNCTDPQSFDFRCT